MRQLWVFWLCDVWSLQHFHAYSLLLYVWLRDDIMVAAAFLILS